MTKKKNMIARICGLLIVLTLISCCFLGTTFARYTSNVSGKASVTVAQWDINFGEASTGINLSWGEDKLSPSAQGYDTVGQDVTTNTTALVKVATIKNEGDVDALVTITGANGTALAEEAHPDRVACNAAYTDTITVDAVKGLFTITFTDNQGSPLTSNTFTVSAHDSYDVYAIVTWTTDYSKCESAEDAEAVDALDTYVGQYVTSVFWDVEFTAVQSSELPA